MRIPLMVLGLTLACGSLAEAQGVTAGVRAGVNLSNLAFDGGSDNPSLDPRTGVAAGAFVTLPFFWRLEVQPEVLYSSKGARFDEEGIRSSLVLDYVDVPVLIRMTRGAGGANRFYVAAGPTAAFRLRAKNRVEFGGSTEELDISEEVERMDLGVAAAAGFELGSLVFDGRYTLGLSDIDKDKTDSVKIRNRGFSLTAGWRF